MQKDVEITLIGEPVTMGSLAAGIEKTYGRSTRVLCPLKECEDLIGEKDAIVLGEEAMEEALKEVPADALAMGNLDPVSLFKMSSPEEMKKATLQLLEATAAYPNFVLSSGCDIPPYTPLANINAFYTALEEFNETRN